jgi:hypothetical protein
MDDVNAPADVDPHGIATDTEVDVKDDEAVAVLRSGVECVVVAGSLRVEGASASIGGNGDAMAAGEAPDRSRRS